MTYSAALELTEAGPAHFDVPHRMERASVVLSHGLLVGDLLGVDIAAAQRALDAVAERDEPVFTADEVERLRSVVRDVREGLRRATDEAGLVRPGPAGDALRASDLLETRSDGVLVVRHRRMPLPQLGQHLAVVERMLDLATTHGAGVRLQQT